MINIKIEPIEINLAIVITIEDARVTQERIDVLTKKLLEDQQKIRDASKI